MLILPKLEAPLVPLLTGNDEYDLANINSYLQNLVGYFYSCNAPLIEQDQVMVPSSAARTDLWPDAVSSVIYNTITISSAYTGGNITFKINRRGAATGTAIMQYAAYRLRNNAAFVTLASAVSINFTPGNINTITTTITLTSPDIQRGDIVRFDVTRLGADAGDTMVGDVANDGVTFTMG